MTFNNQELFRLAFIDIPKTLTEEERKAFISMSDCFWHASMSGCETATFMLVVEDSIKNTITIPVPIVQSGKIIEMICPVDFGEISARVYYYSDNMLRIQTSRASVEIWGAS